MINNAEEFIRLRLSTVKADYDRSANEPLTTEAWSELVDDHPDMHVWVVHNKTVPVEVLRRILNTDPPARVRDAIARKRKLPVDLQRIMADDLDEDVRLALIPNAKLDLAILEQIAREDESDFVREKALRWLQKRIA